MIPQIINLTPVDVFRYYAEKFGVPEGRYSFGLYGLELRHLRRKDAEKYENVISAYKERVYLNVESGETISILLIGSLRRFKIIAERILRKIPGNSSIKLFNTINFFENYELTSYKIGDKLFEFKDIYVMGILNVTPDSFSDGGKYLDKTRAINFGIKMLENGADIIDIGGESSRPGAQSIDPDTEINRVMPVVEGILNRKPDAVLSVDTTKNEVAELALNAGAKIINDISGGTFEPDILKTVAKHKAAYVVMHMKGRPSDMQRNPGYENVIEEIYDFLYRQIEKAKSAGIQHIFVDPGIGFGKRVEDNFYIIKRLEDFKSLSYPILLGVSRKSFLGKFLDLKVDFRDVPTSITEAFAVNKGARIIRTHNVRNGVMLKNLLNKSKSVNI
ncbi:dihydropteroate synthase [bacterium BMS3Abin03]|nr:dihydropteroate synthase [bacterium BMS3Abin03]MCG6960082.1 dihydropteroate synthase [bacterium BMS3Abin03]